MGNLIIFLILLLAACCTVTAQEYSYVHYDTKDGLAGSTVYDLCQDKDGFIWFATEAGLSRFDGTHFRNFTMADGLPENEILRLFSDSKGRTWIAPFKHTVCYYYKGKIYTQENNAQLQKAKLHSVPVFFSEDSKQNIGLIAGNDIVIIKADTNNSTSVTNFSWRSTSGYLDPDVDGFPGFAFYSRDSLFLLNEGNPVLIRTYPWKKSDSMALTGKVEKNYNYVPLPPNSTGMNFSQGVFFVNSINGSYLIDSFPFRRYADIFLRGKHINRSIIDNEQNFWFATTGEGVYKLTSREIKTWQVKKGKPFEIYSLEKWNNQMLAGADMGRVFPVTRAGLDTISFNKYLRQSTNSTGSNRLLSIKNVGQTVLLAFDGFLAKYDPVNRRTLVNYIDVLKSVDEADGDTLLVGTGRRTVLMSKEELKILDTIWPYRSTAVCYHRSIYYIGTVDGLYIIRKDRSVRFLGDQYPILKTRISSILKTPGGDLWITTYGRGMVNVRGEEVKEILTTRQGLSSDICQSGFLKDQILWVGTDKGITKVDLATTPHPVTYYSMADGLPSNLIHAIYVDSNIVYVGSPAGLTFFDETKLSNHSRCDLRVLDISVSGNPMTADSTGSIGRLSHRDNNFKISYVGISFKSAGDILYRYRLKGLKDTWDTTRQTVLEYPSLPFGDYQLELIAVNKFGVASSPLLIPFIIATPFWQTTWFRLLIIVIAALLVWTFINWRLRLIRKRDAQEAAFRQQMNELEQLALRSQMNPHFIFNCLNSIQNFIVHKDFETTNTYLTEFAYLIRQTLENSTKSSITIENEVTYLNRYLAMERMRFDNAFRYTLYVDPSFEREFTYIPAMILQPYIENSIRHGVRYITDGTGLIEIEFRRVNKDLLCIIKDNGIGRKKAGEFRSHLHFEYQSRGMSLTADRIKALNREASEPITITVIDLEDERSQPTGTKVEIRFPNIIHTIIQKPQSL